MQNGVRTCVTCRLRPPLPLRPGAGTRYSRTKVQANKYVPALPVRPVGLHCTCLLHWSGTGHMEHGCWGMGTVTWVKGWLPSCSADTLSAAPPSLPAGERHNTIRYVATPAQFGSAPPSFFFPSFHIFPTFCGSGEKRKEKKSKPECGSHVPH